MTEHNLRHLEFTRAVVETDLAYVDKKDREYNGSWKLRGGIGAFMMLARKWDRLENMLKGNFSYNVFAAIENQTADEQELAASRTPKGYKPTPSIGSDGTVLAEIRDLRRYLILVEAEMMARGVVPIDAEKLISTHGDNETLKAFAEQDRTVPRMREQAPYAGDTPSCGDGLFDVRQQRTEEDGAQASSLAPYVVSSGFFLRKNVNPEAAVTFWRQVGDKRNDQWALEPSMVYAKVPVPGIINHLYETISGIHVIRIQDVPPDARDLFPYLERELNSTQVSWLPPWQRVLYKWSEENEKHYLENKAWARD